MADIFISYAHQDRETAKQLAAALSAFGWEVWWDRTLPPGTRFRAEIARQLQAAKCVVVLWSGQSVESDWVVDEAEEAKSRGVLVQAIISHVQPPHGFRQIHSGNLQGWTGQPDAPQVLELRAGIARYAGSATRPEPQFATVGAGTGEPTAQRSIKQGRQTSPRPSLSLRLMRIVSGPIPFGRLVSQAPAGMQDRLARWQRSVHKLFAFMIRLMLALSAGFGSVLLAVLTYEWGTRGYIDDLVRQQPGLVAVGIPVFTGPAVLVWFLARRPAEWIGGILSRLLQFSTNAVKRRRSRQ